MYPDIWFRTYIPTHTIWQLFFPNARPHTHMFYSCVPLGCTFLFATEKSGLLRFWECKIQCYVPHEWHVWLYVLTFNTPNSRSQSSERFLSIQDTVCWVGRALAAGMPMQPTEKIQAFKGRKNRITWLTAFMTGNGLFPSRFAKVPRITWVRLTSYSCMGSKPRSWSSSTLCRANLASMRNEAPLLWSCAIWCACSFMRAISTHWDDYCVRYLFQSTFVETCFPHIYCKIVWTCADVLSAVSSQHGSWSLRFGFGWGGDQP